MAFDFACPDWFERLQAGRTPIADLPLDEAAADRAVAIFDYLRIPDVVGTPPLCEAAGDWLRDIVRAIFGSVDASGRRQVGEVFVLVPKKNSKTTSSAAIALTFMLLNQRPKADMLIVAPTQKIAETAFAQAKGMIEADPVDEETGRSYLQDRFHVQEHKSTIRCRVTGARLMIRTFDAKVLTGAKPVFCLIDETHELGKVPYAADVIRQIRGGMYPFPESLLVQITTQSDHRPTGVFASELNYARRVRDGEVTEGVKTLPVLYEFPAAMQVAAEKPWLDPDCWHLVSPNLGRSITREALVEGFRRAQEDGQNEVIAWATQHLNLEVGVALNADRWVGAEGWAECRRDKLTLGEIIETSDVAVIGADCGGRDDLFGLAVIGRHRETRVWQMWAHAWCLPIVLRERRKSIATTLEGFERDGDLTIAMTEQDMVAEAARICVMVREAGLLPEEKSIGIDPARSAAFEDALVAEGFEMGTEIVGVPQTYQLQRGIGSLEGRLLDRRAVHGGQPLLDWCVSNARAEARGQNVYITKEAAGVAKIDPLMALFDAAYLMSFNPEGRQDIGDFLNNVLKVAV